MTIGGQGSRSTGVNLSLDTVIGKAFLDAHASELKPVYSMASINLQVYEYVEFLRGKAPVPVVNVNWFRMVALVIQDAALDESAERARGVLSDLAKIISKECSGATRLWFLFLTRAVSSTPIFQLLRWYSKRKKENGMEGMRDAGVEFGAGNVYEFSVALHQQLEADGYERWPDCAGA